MKRYSSFIALLLIIALVGLAGCTEKKPEQAKESPPNLTQGNPPVGENAVAGIEWTPPSGWNQAPPRPMRIVTYTVAAKEGEGGECAVFFFGGGEGGNIDANIARWASQFDGSPEPKRSAREVNGMKVTMVEIAGTYLSPGGPMMQSQGKKSNYRLLGAIVDAPEGSVFFKFTGPDKTINEAEDEFNELIGSLKKTG